jgi:hypothetical protein
MTQCGFGPALAVHKEVHNGMPGGCYAAASALTGSQKINNTLNPTAPMQAAPMTKQIPAPARRIALWKFIFLILS